MFTYAFITGVKKGWLALQTYLDADGNVDQVCVAREWRGRGIGRALMDRAIAETRRLGMSRLELEAGKTVQPGESMINFLVMEMAET